MGGMQAQDYLGSLWAIALRTKNCTEKDVEDAISERKIVRTWQCEGPSISCLPRTSTG